MFLAVFIEKYAGTRIKECVVSLIVVGQSMPIFQVRPQSLLNQLA